MTRIGSACFFLFVLPFSAQAAITTSVSKSPTVGIPGFVTDTITASVIPGEKIIGFDFVSVSSGYGFFGQMSQVNPLSQPTVFADLNSFYPFAGADPSQDSQFKVEAIKGLVVQPSEGQNFLKAAFNYNNQYVASEASNSWSFVQIAHSAEVNYRGTLTVKNVLGVNRLELIVGVLPAVPEPSSLALLGLATIATASLSRLRRSIR